MTERTVTALESCTGSLGAAYDLWKNSETLKNEIKSEFFDLATRQYEAVAERVVENIIAFSIEEAEEWIQKSNPFWLVDTIRLMEDENDLYEAVLVERIDFKPFVYENEDDGRTYRKQVSAGSVYLDDDRLRKYEPDLYERIAYETPWGDWVLMPLEFMTDERRAALADYIYEGRPTVKLTVSRPK